MKTPFCHIIEVMNEKYNIITIIFHPKYTHSSLKITTFKCEDASRRVQMDGEDLIEKELTNTKLVDMAFKVVEASPSNVDWNVDPIPNVDDQPPTNC
jgi:hypothetical protein